MSTNTGGLKHFLVHGLTTPFRWVAQAQRWIAERVTKIPGWPRIEAIAEQVTRPLRATADLALQRFPSLKRAEWLLETERLRSYPPVLLASTIALTTFRGLQTTRLGHIGTDPLIYPLLAMISGLNPFLGCFCAVCFAVGDLAQKLLWNDIYGTPPDWFGHYLNLDFWGSIVGYTIAYSSPFMMALVPGMMARVARVAMRQALRAIFYRQAAAAADGATPFGGARRLFARQRSDGSVEWIAREQPPDPSWIAQSDWTTREEAEATLDGIRSGELTAAFRPQVIQTGQRAADGSEIIGLSNAVSVPPPGPGRMPPPDAVSVPLPGPGRLPPPAIRTGQRMADGSEIVGLSSYSTPRPPTQPQGPVVPNYSDPRTQDALRGLRDQGLLNDPDAWRNYRDAAGNPLGWRERQILGNLRGRRLLQPGNDAVVEKLLGGQTTAAAAGGSGDGPPSMAGLSPYEAADGGPSYPVAEAVASAIALGFTAAGIASVASPVLESPAFDWRPNPDTSCKMMEAGILQAAAPFVGTGGAVIGTAGEVLAKPVPGRGGASVPMTAEERQRDIRKRLNDIDPYALQGNRELQEDLRDLINQNESGGGIDEEKLREIERQAGVLGVQKAQEWDAETEAALDRSRKAREAQVAKEEAGFERQRELGNKLNETLGRIAKGDLNSASGLGLDPNQVYNPDGSINQQKLDDFIDQAKDAKRDLAQQQRDDAAAVADSQNVVGTVMQVGETASRVTRNVAITAGGGLLTGGAGAAAGGGFLGWGAGAMVGTVYGGVTGGVRAASEAGSMDINVIGRGTAQGIVGGAFGGAVGAGFGMAGAGLGFLAPGLANSALVNAAATFVGKNPAVAGAIFGGIGAKVFGGDPWEGMLEGAVGGKFADLGGRAVAAGGGVKGFRGRDVEWNAPADPHAPLSSQKPGPDDVQHGMPEASPPRVGRGETKGPRVGLDTPEDKPWLAPPERRGGAPPERGSGTPLRPDASGQRQASDAVDDGASAFGNAGRKSPKPFDGEPPPDSDQPWSQRWDKDPVTGKPIDRGIPESARPDPNAKKPDPFGLEDAPPLSKQPAGKRWAKDPVTGEMVDHGLGGVGQGPREGPLAVDDGKLPDYLKAPERGRLPKPPDPAKPFAGGEDITPPSDSEQPWSRRFPKDTETKDFYRDPDGNPVDMGPPEGTEAKPFTPKNDAPPDAAQPWRRKQDTGADVDPHTLEPLPKPAPKPVDPDELPWNKHLKGDEQLPADYEGPGKTDLKKYPGGRGNEAGGIDPYETQAQKEARIKELSELPPNELDEKVRQAEIFKGKKEAALHEEAQRRQDGKPAPKDIGPDDHLERQAAVDDKLKNMSRKELEARKLIADVEGNKKDADLYGEALNRSKEPKPIVPVDRDNAVDQLAESRPPTSRPPAAETETPDEAWQASPPRSDGRPAVENPQTIDDKINNVKRDLDNLNKRVAEDYHGEPPSSGGRPSAKAPHEAAELKEQIAQREHALEQLEQQKVQQTERLREVRDYLTSNPAEKADHYINMDQKRLGDAMRTGHLQPGEYGAVASTASGQGPGNYVFKNTQVVRIKQEDVIYGTKLDNGHLYDAKGVEVPLQPGKVVMVGGPGAEHQVMFVKPDGQVGSAIPASKLERWAPSENRFVPVDPTRRSVPPVVPDAPMPGRAVAPAVGEPAPPVIPPTRTPPPPVDDVDVTPKPQPPTRTEVHSDDLPPPNEPITDDQLAALRSSKYTNEDLLAARDQARARKDGYEVDQIERALDDRGYRASVDPADLTTPPPGELPDFAQVQNLANKYSTAQLKELWIDAQARGDRRLRDILQQAMSQKMSKL